MFLKYLCSLALLNTNLTIAAVKLHEERQFILTNSINRGYCISFLFQPLYQTKDKINAMATGQGFI